MSDKETVGYIGLGNMGAPMTRNLLKAGYPVLVHDLDPARMEALANEGASTADSPAEVARQVSVVFSSLPTTQSVEEVVKGTNGIAEGGQSGLIYIDTSTIPPPVCAHLADVLKPKGIDMLDAPVTGGKAGSAAGTLGIMVGGNRVSYEKCLPLFEAIGRVIRHFGEKVGSGMHAKMANQIMVAINLAAVAEAIAYGAKAELDLDLLVEILKSGRAASEQLNVNSPGILDDNLEEVAAMGPMTLLHKDMECIVESMAAMGVTESFSKQIRDKYQILIDRDRGKREVARDCMGLLYLAEEEFDVKVVSGD